MLSAGIYQNPKVSKLVYSIEQWMLTYSGKRGGSGQEQEGSERVILVLLKEMNIFTILMLIVIYMYIYIQTHTHICVY